MAQFDVYRNTSTRTNTTTPFLVDVQAELLDTLSTRVVIPLITKEHFGLAAEQLNPTFTVNDVPVVLSTAELAGIPKTLLKEKVDSLARYRNSIINALDLLLTGF